jgi:hypothetical protein
MHAAGMLARAGLIGCLLLTGCRVVPGASSPPSAVQDKTPVPTGLSATPPEPHPQVTFTDLTVVPGDEPGVWLVLGMARNDSHDALEAVVISVEVLDPVGEPAAATTVPVALSILQPGATSPFSARFEQAHEPQNMRAHLWAFRFSSEAPVHVSMEAVRSSRSSEGTRVLGRLRNLEPRTVQAQDVVVVWREADQSLAGMATATVPRALVPDDGMVPWMAEAPGALPGSRVEVFAAVSAVEDSIIAPLESVAGPTWRVTSQGRGFAVGTLRNPGRDPVLPEVAIAVLAGGRLVSLEILRSSIPLPSGETLDYAADRFPGMEADPNPADGITFELYLAGRPMAPDAPSAVPLLASIQQFESIGSRVFMQGTATNPGPTLLKSAVVLVSLRSTTGEIQTARWLDIDPPQPGESAEFSIDFPIAAGDDPSMSEYDLRAVGIPLAESSW